MRKPTPKKDQPKKVQQKTPTPKQKRAAFQAAMYYLRKNRRKREG